MSKTEESNFHDEYVRSCELRAFESRFYSREALAKENDMAFKFLGDLRGKNLLFYGSGAHYSLIREFVKKGAKVIAIDISPASINILYKACKREGLWKSVTPLVMDCESLGFGDESIDIVFGRSIVHHLDVDTSLREISRVLKPTGKFTVLEPLGMNPLINLYRRLTPKSRTTGEHPLVSADLKLFNRYFHKIDRHYLYFLTIIAYIYKLLDKNDERFISIFNGFFLIDELLLRAIPYYSFLCWDVLLCCQKDTLNCTVINRKG